MGRHGAGLEALAAAWEDPERQAAELRTTRESLIEKMQGLELTLQRSCNDLGILYGSVTQHDLAIALNEVGFAIKDREVRLGQTIKPSSPTRARRRLSPL